MSDTAQTAGNTGSGQSYQGVQPTPVTGWAGWIAFAAAMMLLLGVFHLIAGLVALFKDDYYVVGSSGLVLSVDYTAWGWIHLLGGGVMCAAGLGLLVGQMWARVVAVLLAMLSAIANLVFLAANPIWSTIMITLAVLVIWAVTVHGSEMKNA
ncbi:DUF7144 family membrane protein [Nocardioides sp.]|uniref:DUF7144 family membrane protein n=1 Tax=Nocardioides sp. TaxID=35761 RepID=UPI003BEF04C0